MTPRPVSRWKSFWLGILVLGFLGWAWWDSNDMRAGATWHPLGTAFIVGHQDSRIAWLSFSAKRDPREPRWSSYREKIYGGYFGPRFPPAVHTKEHIIEVAYWFLMLLFLIPWSAFLAWRWRRQRILTKAHDAAPAH